MKLLSIEDVVRGGTPIEGDLRALFRKNQQLRLFDIGACTGEHAIIYSNLFPNAKIIAFEPLPKNLEVMREHFKKFGKEHCIEVVDIALSDQDENALFYISGGSPYKDEEWSHTTILPKEWNKSSSLLKPGKQITKKYPWLRFNEVIRVKTQRLDGYLKENEIHEVDFIHMDVQGAELSVLKGLGEMITKVKAIWLEAANVELYEKQPLKREIVRYLSQFHFYLTKDTSRGKTDGDCLFVRGFKRFLFFKLKRFMQLPKRAVRRYFLSTRQGTVC